MMELIPIHFNFTYYHTDDTLEFTFRVGNAPQVGLRLPADGFLQLVDLIVKVWKPYYEGLKEKRVDGVKEDSTTEFDIEQWTKLVEGK